MPAELPAEINRQVNKAIILLSQTSNPSDITIIVKQLVLAAIPIVERKTVKECCDLINGMMQALAISRDRAEIAGRQGVAECRQSDVETCQRLIQRLSRWKMED